MRLIIYLSNSTRPMYYNLNFPLFLAHLSQRLKWGFLIKICSLSVVVVFVVVVLDVVNSSESHFHFLQNIGPISTKLGTMRQWLKGIQVFFSNEGPYPLPREDYYEIAKIPWWNFKNLLLKNHWANFNQTWHKAFLDD